METLLLLSDTGPHPNATLVTLKSYCTVLYCNFLIILTVLMQTANSQAMVFLFVYLPYFKFLLSSCNMSIIHCVYYSRQLKLLCIYRYIFLYNVYGFNVDTYSNLFCFYHSPIFFVLYFLHNIYILLLLLLLSY